ncbi:asparaginase [Nocardioides sp. zg-ZUI104]|uniref:asparaginase domain-containing protein n=1 Tax=Nocardioides faecalis TaxID=2803858 RepID=UPI001BCC44FF|nr:asparaginase domain-containing protein [Nocardioides faecalis]MBS4753442.1 asparaginase [Nocardioides faecalis]
MSRPVLAVGALGGTIASTPSAAGGSAVVPTAGAAELAAAVPGLADLAAVRATTLARLPSPSLAETDLLGALAWARAEVGAGAQGVVLTQGTDTLEESAFLLDLLWDSPVPLVLTGAMRAADAAGADGPANLLTAARVALAPASAGRGVLVALAEQVHAARWVSKTDSMAPAAFASPSFGPVGRCVETEVRYAAPPPRRAAALAVPGDRASAARRPRVPLVATHLGDDGFVLGSLDLTGVDAVVVAGLGAGHVSTAMADVIGQVAAVVPVVVATRTGAGPTARATYGYPGAELDLLDRGVLGAGWLPPVKARLLLWALALTGPLDRGRVAAALAEHGAP